MDWDLKSYFPVFDGPEYRKFWQSLTTELAALAQPLPGAGDRVDQIADGSVDWLIRYEKATTHLFTYRVLSQLSDGGRFRQ